MILINSKISGVCAAILLMCIFVPAADASSVVRTGNDISISEDQIIEGDFYSAASTHNLSGVVTEDAMIVGGQITINGEIQKNAFLLGASVDVHGSVGDDLRIVGGEVIVADPVLGDFFVVGGVVKILSTANIEGDVIVYGGEVVIEGRVGGDVIGVVSDMRIDSNVVGNIDVTVNNLTLGSNANIEGSVSYVSSKLLVRALDATIVGDPIRNDPVLIKEERGYFAWVLPSLVLLFSTLVWYLVSRTTLNLVVSRAVVKTPRPMFLGIVSIIFVPIAASLLLLSVIGSMVGTILMLLYALMVILSFVALLAVLGKVFTLAFSKEDKETSLTSLLAGIFGIVLLTMLPVIGGFILGVLFIVTFGSMVDILLRPNPSD